MADSALRLVAILQKIPRSPRKVALGDIRNYLAELGLTVTDRTIQRDLEKLSELFPLEVDTRSKPYGWSFMSTAKTSMPSLHPYEALTMLMAGKFLSDSLPSSLNDYLFYQKYQAADALEPYQNKKLKKWLDKIAFVSEGFNLKKANIKKSVIENVYDGLLHDKKLIIDYKDKLQQEVHPLGIILKERHIYLVCTFWRFEKPVQIALNRIKSIKVMEEKSKAPHGFSLDSFIKDGQANIVLSEEPISLKIKITIAACEHLIETPINESQVISQIDEKWNLLTATVENRQDLRWWLLGFGFQVEVVSPVSLRQEFKTMAEKMSLLYEQ
ncbi:helix-turn-helix transcriptional regulator [Litorilituus lipolyticus]|uniref:WYL domain-containing protein n=1 Tax=Litorilituus lipolyticus TaxID=2491017 RepID=A0A502L1J3_9GAMM|nr:WYL domain-containing protein [Litorilituus lipolyticus]TPH15863.1 WYL domain-containing protein [Litorilituus lipolyticus]